MWPVRQSLAERKILLKGILSTIYIRKGSIAEELLNLRPGMGKRWVNDILECIMIPNDESYYSYI